jgi:hypothetical protein
MPRATAFFTPCLRKRFSAFALALACLLGAASAFADNVKLKQAQLLARDEGYVLDAEFDLELPGALVDSVNRGVALYFVLEVDISRPRWYWLDERPINYTRTYKLTYAPLVQQYRLASGLYSQNFARIDDVRRALSRVRSLPVADRSALKKGEAYQSQIRFRLDTTQLPKPLQLGVVGSRDWVVTTEWQPLPIVVQP